jgi:hypothetical protein
MIVSIDDLKEAYIRDLLRNLPVEVHGLTVYRKGKANSTNMIVDVQDDFSDDERCLLLYAGLGPTVDDLVKKIRWNWDHIGNPNFGSELVDHVLEVCRADNSQGKLLPIPL